MIMIERLAPWLAGMFYGGWAAYSNVEHELSNIVMAFIIQGGFAFLSTWLLTSFITWLIQRQQPSPQYRFIFLQCAAMLVFIPGGLHMAAGTPNIIQAMLPGLIIGNSYAGFLIYRSQLK